MNGRSAAVVTAAAGTIGRAIVERLLAQDIVQRVIALDVAESAEPLPDGADLSVCDVLDPTQLASLANRLPRRVDVLVNVLGGERQPPLCPVEDVAWPPDKVWDDIFEMNVSAAFRVTRAVLKRLVPGAVVCNISSIAAAMPWAISPAYGAAKAALEHWTRSLAVHLADRGIRVNVVRPGFVWSRQWNAVDRNEFDRIVENRVPLCQVAGQTPTGREQTAADVAAAVAFLCSRAAAHTTGQVINVDGGAALIRAAR